MNQRNSEVKEPEQDSRNLIDDTMMMPVRCFSCGAVVADKWDDYDKKVNKDHVAADKVLDEMGVKRYCCRRMFISNVELIDEFIQFGRK